MANSDSIKNNTDINKPENNNGSNNVKKSEVFELISNFFFSFFFTFFAIIAISQILLRIFGFHMLNVETGSMQPELPVNSLIFVQQIDPSEIKKGDIITFVINQNGVLATHRVKEVHTGSRTFVTKGDANNTDDGEILWDNVVGIVRFKIPKIGKFFQTITSQQNRPVVIALIIILVVAISVWEVIIKIIDKIREKKSADSA